MAKTTQKATKWSTAETYCFFEQHKDRIRAIINENRDKEEAFTICCTELQKIINDLLYRFIDLVDVSEIYAICHGAFGYIHVEEIVDRVLYHPETLPDN